MAFWGFICFHFGLSGPSFHFISFWPFGLSFLFILASWAFIYFHFGLFGVHLLSFWLLGLHFFHFGLLGLHFLSFLYFGLSFPLFCFFSFPFILFFWAFTSFYHGILAIPLAIPLDTLLDALENQKCAPHARISLHGKVLAFSCIFQFVPAFVLMDVALYLKRSSHSMLKRTAVPWIAVIHTRLTLKAALMSGCKAGHRGSPNINYV